VISSVTRAFCRDCTRARLSTEGKLYLCLFANHGYDLRALLRGDRERPAATMEQLESGRRPDLEDTRRPLFGTSNRNYRSATQGRDVVHRRLGAHVAVEFDDDDALHNINPAEDAEGRAA
jgi:hypothetical protein